MLPSHFVPCRQDVSSVRFFACTISVRAYQTAPPCQICKTFDAPVLCAATADVLRTGLHVQVSLVRRNQAGACCCRAFATQRVRSKVESLRALHQCTNVQRRSASHTAPATRVARPAPVESLITTFVESLRTVRGARAAESVCVRLRCAAFATRPATVELLRLLACQCNGRRAETIAFVSASACTDALRRSKLKFAGRRFHERSLRADDANRGVALSDVAELGGSQAALHRP